MSNAVIVDKDLAKGLWLKGFSATDIAVKLGTKRDTVSQWVHRYGWKREADVTRPIAKAAQALAIQEVADEVSALASEQAKRLMHVIRDSKVKTLTDAKIASTALSASYATARKALGLDDKQGHNGKNWGGGISIDVHLSPGSSLSLNENKVIDVTPKQLPEASQ